MTVTSPRSIHLDQTRVALVVLLGVAQAAVVVAGAFGSLGTRVGDVAQAHPTPLLPAWWASLIWIPIGLGFLAYAGYQCFPRQRHRHLHRRTGWWLAAAALCTLLWTLSWTTGRLLLAELLLVGVLVSTAVVFGRLSREPATSTAERAAFRVPVSVYAGWASTAMVVGTATTGAWIGLPGATAIASVAAVIVLIAFATIVAWVILNGTAVVGYVAAVAWAIAAIVANEPPAAVSGAAVLVLVVVFVSTVRRLATSADRVRAAFG
ncbi:hypothetical protein SAMN05443637_12683 [Pseudonocardia thermophila]|jgi:hypothetical protein|uniref:TspO and MBR related proteins n=1 Tax=Pseudonocardia thermophila TaxID=1848 RepID=A0A1M7A947_PSETH|nr:hypothetical protein [Pseudonocardia thermophila]SHL39158.1 hypothetical protein SAMN05443637_12683 [Pseudonocardia thermophila]